MIALVDRSEMRQLGLLNRVRLDFGELLVLLLIIVAISGRIRLPGLGESIERIRARGVGVDRPRLLLQRRSARRWTLSEWRRFGAAVVFAAAVMRAPLRRTRTLTSRSAPAGWSPCR